MFDGLVRVLICSSVACVGAVLFLVECFCLFVVVSCCCTHQLLWGFICGCVFVFGLFLVAV
jgi:hypothetical protein